MRFNNYILLSVLFHLLFFGILGAAHSNGRERERVFNVDIVEAGPLKAPEIYKIKPFLKKRRFTRSRRRPPAKRLPNSLWDDPSSPSTKGGEADAVPPDVENKSSRLPRKKDSSLPDSGPSFLFDRDVINKYASNIPQPEKGLVFDTSEFKNRGYMRRLKEKIERIWEYPKEAVRKKMSGDLLIRFTINRKGNIGEVEVLRTSGHRSLDRAAEKALKTAAPFWPLPDDWPDEHIEITGRFIYIFGRTYVM